MFCRNCVTHKPSTEFYAKSTTLCKTCNVIINRRWAIANRSKVKKVKAEWYANNKEHNRMQKRRKAYNISPEQWHEMFNRQGKCCAICKSPTPNTTKDWATDHDPNTGKVRGILCMHCNLIVRRHATPEILRAAADYLTPSEDH